MKPTHRKCGAWEENIRGEGVVRKRKESEFWQVRYYDDHGVEQKETALDPRTGQKLPWRDPAGTTAPQFSSSFQAEQDNEKTYNLALKYLRARRHEVEESKLGTRPFVPMRHMDITMNEVLGLIEPEWRRTNNLKAISPQFRSHLKACRAAFGFERAMRLVNKPKLITEYVTEKLDAGVMPATLNRRLQLLTQGFNLAIKQKLLTRKPDIEKLEENNTRMDFMEPSQFHAVLALLPAYLHDYVNFAWCSMWRKTAIASLDWQDVDSTAVRLPGAKSKNGSPVIIPLYELDEEGNEVLSDVGQIIERCRAGRVYKTEAGEERLAAYVFHVGGRKIGDIRKAWHTACLRAGLAQLVCPKCRLVGEDHKRQYVPVDGDGRCPRCDVKRRREYLKYRGPLFHGLRRSGAKDWCDAGIDEGTIMGQAGWRSNAMFKRYCIRPLKAQQIGMRKARLHREAESKRNKVVVLKTGTEGA